MPRRCFIAKIAVEGGPDPVHELDQIVACAEADPEGLVWFATRKPGAELADGNDSWALVIGPAIKGQPIDGIWAQIVEHVQGDAVPDDPTAQELYEEHGEFRGWWRLQHPIRLRFAALGDIPGRHYSSGNNAADTFRGQVSFAYWNFAGNPGDSMDRFLGFRRRNPPTAPGGQGTSLQRPPRRPSGGAAAWPPEGEPKVPPGLRFYGVDFSGGREIANGNRKIWIAEWGPNEGILTLRCGTDNPSLRRSDLPGYISAKRGWWALDFPFGVAQGTAAVLGIFGPNAWMDWLNWCAGGADATERRDTARQAVVEAGQDWTQRRAVDVSNGTTWFPLFEQLYRQTIYGAAEVLLPVSQLHSQSICVLPWHDVGDKKVVVVEGFPGVTLRERLGFPGTGYKGKREECREARSAILEALSGAPFRVLSPGNPTHEQIRERAIADCEGDAVDALILLVAARRSWALPSEGWQQERQTLAARNALVEGWFPG